MPMFKTKIIENWKKGESIRVYSQLEDPPFHFSPLISPIRLFGLYYGKDGSLYTEHYVAISGATYERFENGQKIHSQDVPIEAGAKLKTSLHGSGQVVGFERVIEEGPRAHLGFALRDIDGPQLLAEQHIGTAGHYIGNFEESPSPTKYSVLVSGLFETIDLPVFSIWVSPEGADMQDGTVVSATTRLLENNRKLTFSITLSLRKVPQRVGDHRQVIFTSLSQMATS